MEHRGFAKQLREDGKLLGAWCMFASFSSAEVMTHRTSIFWCSISSTLN